MLAQRTETNDEFLEMANLCRLPRRILRHRLGPRKTRRRPDPEGAEADQDGRHEETAMSETPTQQRPWWVRLAVRRISTRRAAFSQLAILALIFCILFVFAGAESASESLFGRIAFGVDLVGMVLIVILALWMWLAVRWMDRNSQWR
jgi:hypothetical protein